MMGIALCIIGHADFVMGHNYILHPNGWLQSSTCKIVGILVIISLEASPIFMLNMSLHFFIVTNKQIVGNSSKKKMVTLVLLIVWGMIMSGSVFLSQHLAIVDPTCLYFRLTRKQSKGWEVTVGLVLVFNFLVYSTIGHLLYDIIRQMQRQQLAAQRSITSDEVCIIVRQAIITVNCFLPWLIIASVCLFRMLSEHVDPPLPLILYP